MTKVSAAPSLEDVKSFFKDYSGDETGGLHAIRGFSFQIWQAVLEALRAHATGDDYAVVLEWQQDIALLDSSRRPTKVKFIQVKKNESSHHWTLNGLLSASTNSSSSGSASVASTPSSSAGAATAPAKKGKSKTKVTMLSVLAKLYFHRRRFATLTATDLVFASNAPFYVGVGDAKTEETVTRVLLTELPEEAQKKVVMALRKQLDIPDSDVLPLDDVLLEVTNCPIEDSLKFAVGELSYLCDTLQITPKVKAPLQAVCLIAAQVRQKMGTGRYAKDFETLLQRAVTRNEVSSYFAAANDSQITTQNLVEKSINRLNIEAADYEMVREMEEQVNSACAEITNRASPVWPTVTALAELFKLNNSYKAQGPLKARFPAWLSDLRKCAPEDSALYKDGYLFCIMAMILNNARPTQHLSAAPTDSQPEAQK